MYSRAVKLRQLNSVGFTPQMYMSVKEIDQISPKSAWNGENFHVKSQEVPAHTGRLDSCGSPYNMALQKYAYAYFNIH